MKTMLSPAFKENNIPIVFSTNESFVPVLSVMLQSVIENSSEKNNYDIIILSQDISKEYSVRLHKMVEGQSNFSIRIFNVSNLLDGYSLYIENRPDITVETYFRLLMPDLLGDYAKAIYLDGDMIANADIADLYKINLEGYLVASSIDCDSIGRYHLPEPEIKEYRDKVLKLRHPDEYFCAGMLVLNLDEFRRTMSSHDLLEFASSYPWKQHDQDVLNVICQGKTKLISPAWDVLRDAGNNKYMPKHLYQEYLLAENHPKIIHYGGRRKPWIYLDVERGQYFWKYVGKTPFYKEILSLVDSANISRYPQSVLPQGQKNYTESSAKDFVLQQFSQGKIGFRYVIKYLLAWMKYKIKHPLS